MVSAYPLQECNVRCQNGTANLLLDHELDILGTQGKSVSTPPSESDDAVSRVALLFHSAALATLIVVSMVWRQHPRDNNNNDYAKVPLDASDADLESDESGLHPSSSSSGLARTPNLLIRRVWKPSLMALAASLVATSLLAGASKPLPSAATALSLLLGANGILFALANWVPYALIAHEASAQGRARALLAAEGDPADDEDDTPALLAVHNMAIAAPQIGASVASWLLMQGLAGLGLEQRVVWIFVMCVPSALWAAFL